MVNPAENRGYNFLLSSQIKRKKAHQGPSELTIYFYCYAGVFPYTDFPGVKYENYDRLPGVTAHKYPK